MIKRYPMDPVLWSNFLFFVNSYVWLVCGSVLACATIALTACASIAYHFRRESNVWLHRIDQFIAVCALVITVSVAWGSLSALGWSLVGLALLSGLAFKSEAHAHGKSDRYYDGYHVAWHTSVFAGQLCLALSTQSGVL